MSEINTLSKVLEDIFKRRKRKGKRRGSEKRKEGKKEGGKNKGRRETRGRHSFLPAILYFLKRS